MTRDRTWRHAESLNPDRLLDRGYVRVSARPGGAVVTTSAAARAAGAITLHFRDGPLDARVERASGKTYDKASPEKTGPEQPSLL